MRALSRLSWRSWSGGEALSRFLSLVLLAVAVSACHPDPTYVYPEGSVVKVTPGAANTSSDDLSSIIVTDLYPYRDCDGVCERFITTGIPISFVFPKAAHPNRANWKGGPQWNINLTYDRKTMEPFAKTLLNSGIPKWNRTKSNTREYYKRRLSISIGSNLDLRQTARGQRGLAAFNSLDPDDTFGVCGFDFFLHREAYYTLESEKRIGQERRVIGPVEPPLGYYTGVAKSSDQLVQLAKCTFPSPICMLYFDYEGRQVNFGLPRGQFCESEKFAEGISRILDKHRVPIECDDSGCRKRLN